MPRNPEIKKVLMIGSGPIVIGQAAEFDYAGRWFGSGRRRNKTAPVPIFFPLRPPVGPDGMAPKHSWYCAPEGPHNVQGVTPVMGSGGKANMSAPRSS